MDPKNPNYWAWPDYDEPRYSECGEDFYEVPGDYQDDYDDDQDYWEDDF